MSLLLQLEMIEASTETNLVLYTSMELRDAATKVDIFKCIQLPQNQMLRDL